MTSAANRILCRFFFAAATDHYYVCNYCETRRKQLPSSGYAILMSHLKDKHPGYVADYEAHQRSQTGSLSVYGFVNPTVANMYHRMEWVIDRNIPLCEDNDSLTRAMSKLDPVYSKTLKHYSSATAVAIKGCVIAEIDGVYGTVMCLLSERVKSYSLQETVAFVAPSTY